MSVLEALTTAIASGGVRIVDLIRCKIPVTIRFRRRLFCPRKCFRQVTAMVQVAFV